MLLTKLIKFIVKQFQSRKIKRLIISQVKAKKCYEIVVHTCWYGDIHMPTDIWIECNREVITNEFYQDWSESDLLALEKSGILQKTKYWQNPKDEYHSRTTYSVKIDGTEPCS